MSLPIGSDIRVEGVMEILMWAMLIHLDTLGLTDCLENVVGVLDVSLARCMHCQQLFLIDL